MHEEDVLKKYQIVMMMIVIMVTINNVIISGDGKKQMVQHGAVLNTLHYKLHVMHHQCIYWMDEKMDY